MPPKSIPHVVVIGAGSTGSAVAHDLSLRGARVTVIERNEVASGTTGRNHCLVHSGARYVLSDPAVARACAAENAVLRRILPGILEKNGGLFVALSEEELAFRDSFLEGCAACGIPARGIDPREAAGLEPRLRSGLRAAILVPDAVCEPYRLCQSFLAAARSNGAEVRTFTRVCGLARSGRAVNGVICRISPAGNEETLHADAVVNAAGPWAAEIGRMADVNVPLAPNAGVIVAAGERVANRVINRLRPAADGDILVPLRDSALIGTTAQPVPGPEGLAASRESVARMIAAAEELVPGFSALPVRGVMIAARPLISGGGGRNTLCIDHAEEGAENLFTVIGGKTTTARAMAEQTADLVCRRLGLAVECRTADTPLGDWRDVRPEAAR